MLVAILGNMAHAGGASLAYGGTRNINAVKLDGTRFSGFKAGYAVDELSLTVAVDAGDTDDLTGTDIKRHILYGIILVQS